MQCIKNSVMKINDNALRQVTKSPSWQCWGCVLLCNIFFCIIPLFRRSYLLDYFVDIATLVVKSLNFIKEKLSTN